VAYFTCSTLHSSSHANWTPNQTPKTEKEYVNEYKIIFDSKINEILEKSKEEELGLNEISAVVTEVENYRNKT